MACCKKLAVVLLSVFANASASSICDAKFTGFDNHEEQAIVCYAGTFLTKMLTELNSGPAMGATRKTAEHVRVHLLPFLGGEAGLTALRHDTPRTGNCTVCYSDNATAEGLTALRSEVPSNQTAIYDGLRVCYMRLTDAIMDLLHKNDKSDFLVPLRHSDRTVTPEEQVIELFHMLASGGGHHRGLHTFTGCQEVPDVPGAKMPPQWAWMDVCDPKNHGLTNSDEAAVFCFVASFMSKMMWELTLCPPLGWCRKTEEHVRIHFTPYMGGSAVTAKVASDQPSDANCTACYTDKLCAVHQAMWLEKPCCYDNSTTPRCTSDKAPVDTFRKAVKVVNSLDLCYVPFANYFMEALPKIGHWLVSPGTLEAHETPFTKALSITKDIFHKAGVRGCGKPREELPVVV